MANRPQKNLSSKFLKANMIYGHMVADLGKCLKDDEDVKVYLSQNGKFVYKYTKADNSHEYNLMKDLKSPNTVPPIAYIKGQKGYWNCLVMHAYELGDAFTLVENPDVPVSEQVVKQIIFDVIKGLIFLRKKNVCHHDIKPENIFLVKKSNIIHAIIGDFGLSEYIYNNKNQNKYCGTTFYAAPEILETKSYSFSCDMWSLGITMYVLLTKSYPFEGTIPEILKEQLSSKSLSLPANISDDAQDFLNKLVCIDPDARMTPEEAIKHSWFKGISSI